MADDVVMATRWDGEANVGVRPKVPGGRLPTLQRALDWRGAFWAISGVPAGVLLTMGGVATVVGQASWAVWILSVLIGFLQCFVYAEIAGLYPDKSGGHRSMARRPGSGTASSSRRFPYGATGWPGRRCWRWVRGWRPPMS